MAEAENPAKTLTKFTGDGGGNGGAWPANLEKVREYWMKLYKTSVGKPLSEAQNSIFQNRLNEILPHLQRTPDHPPYAWMIEEAIQELAEEGGSSKESISKYIKKVNKDLPWAHETFLTHHLKCLCESGDIVITSNQRYALPSSHSGLRSTESIRKKPARRKQDSGWNKKSNKRQKKDLGKDDLDERNDEAKLIGDKRPSCEPENPKSSKQVHDMQIIDICSANAQMNQKAQYIDAEVDLIGEDRLLCDSEQHKGSKADSKMHIVDIYSSNAGLHQEEQHSNDIQIDNPTQKSPPGFEPMLKSIDAPKRPQGFAVVAPTMLCTNGEGMHSNVDDGMKQVQSPPLEVSAAKNHGEEQIALSSEGAQDSSDQQMQELLPVTTREQINLQAEPIEICNHLKMQDKPTTDETSLPKSQHVSLRGANQGPRIVHQYKRRPPRERGKTEKTKVLDGAQDSIDKKMQALQSITTTHGSVINSQDMEYGKQCAVSAQADPIQICSELNIQALELTAYTTSVPESRDLYSREANQGSGIVYQYVKRPPRKKGKADQIKKQQWQKYEQQHDQRQLDAKIAGLGKPRDSELIDKNELQVLSSGEAKGLELQGLQNKRRSDFQAREALTKSTGIQRKLRSWKKKIQENFEGDSGIQRKLRSWKNKITEKFEGDLDVSGALCNEDLDELGEIRSAENYLEPGNQQGPREKLRKRVVRPA